MDDYLTYLNAMGEGLPYDDSTVLLFMDVLAYTLAETDFVKPELRTSEEFLQALVRRSALTIEQLSNLPYSEELYELLKNFSLAVAARNHQILQVRGEARPQCSLPQPCPYH